MDLEVCQTLTLACIPSREKSPETTKKEPASFIVSINNSSCIKGIKLEEDSEFEFEKNASPAAPVVGICPRCSSNVAILHVTVIATLQTCTNVDCVYPFDLPSEELLAFFSKIVPASLCNPSDMHNSSVRASGLRRSTPSWATSESTSHVNSNCSSSVQNNLLSKSSKNLGSKRKRPLAGSLLQLNISTKIAEDLESKNNMKLLKSEGLENNKQTRLISSLPSPLNSPVSLNSSIFSNSPTILNNQVFNNKKKLYISKNVSALNETAINPLISSIPKQNYVFPQWSNSSVPINGQKIPSPESYSLAASLRRSLQPVSADRNSYNNFVVPSNANNPGVYTPNCDDASKAAASAATSSFLAQWRSLPQSFPNQSHNQLNYPFDYSKMIKHSQEASLPITKDKKLPALISENEQKNLSGNDSSITGMSLEELSLLLLGPNNPVATV